MTDLSARLRRFLADFQIDEPLRSSENEKHLDDSANKLTVLVSSLLEEREREIRDVLEAWVTFTDGAKDPLSSIIVMAHVHGMNYTGPTWEEPLAKTRALLSRLASSSSPAAPQEQK